MANQLSARINVLRRVGNRCDAVLACDACRSSWVFFDFYASPGLDSRWLSEIHYGHCAGIPLGATVDIRLKWNVNSVQRLRFEPSTGNMYMSNLRLTGEQPPLLPGA